MNYFSVQFDKVMQSNTINLNDYIEALYHLIYYRYDCNLDNSSNIKKLKMILYL